MGISSGCALPRFSLHGSLAPRGTKRKRVGYRNLRRASGWGQWMNVRIRTHPGEVLREEYLKPLGMSARALAEAIDVPANRLTETVRERRGVTADTAIRLGKYFDTDARFWINLQVAHDLSKAQAVTDYSRIPTRAA
jgi:antitoxin HigA-1